MISKTLRTLAVAALAWCTAPAWSASAGEYDKDDLRFYYGVGTDFRFTNYEDLDKSIMNGAYSVQCFKCFVNKKEVDTVLFVGSNTGHPSLGADGWGLFGDTKTFLPAVQMEAGAFWQQLQVGFQFSHAPGVVSKKPANSEVVDFGAAHPRVTLDSGGTIGIGRIAFALRDAEFSTTSYSLVMGYQLLPATSPLNITPRILTGLTSANAIFPAAFGYYSKSSDNEEVKPLIITDRVYNALGWHVGLEPELSFTLGQLRLSGSVGYRFEEFNEFLLEEDEELQYIKGKNSTDMSSYYGAFRVSWVFKSRNSVRAAKPNRD